MNKKIPKIYANNIEKVIKNNQEFFDSASMTNRETKTITNYNKDSVNEIIDKLFKRNGYIFNVDVIITTNERVYNTKIAGKVSNHLITLDNNIIYIGDIINIKVIE